jgi:hypothetical protein
VVNALNGRYERAGRSMPVTAEGDVSSLGQVSVNGSVTVSGPRPSQTVSGVLTLTGPDGSIALQLSATKVRSVVGNHDGPVGVTETVIGATGNGTALQGESASGFLGLGPWVRSAHGTKGAPAAGHGSFWLFVGLTPPTT